MTRKIFFFVGCFGFSVAPVLAQLPPAPQKTAPTTHEPATENKQKNPCPSPEVIASILNRQIPIVLTNTFNNLDFQKTNKISIIPTPPSMLLLPSDRAITLSPLPAIELSGQIVSGGGIRCRYRMNQVYQSPPVVELRIKKPQK